MKATGTIACLALALAALPRCGSDAGTPVEVPNPPGCSPSGCVSSVTVSPAAGTVFEGFSIKFSATARDASGHVVTGVTFQWEVSNPEMAEIDASGKLTGKAAGLVQVRAVADGNVGSVDLVVVDATVASLEIGAPPTLLVNESALLTVTARNADGVEVPAPRLQWASSDPAIAQVDFGRAPVVTALRRGTATITVGDRSVEATASLIVRARVVIGRSPFGHFPSAEIAIGDNLQYAAFFVDVDGATIDESPSVTWASLNPHVASVSATGRVIGLQTGGTTITARTPDDMGTMEVHVTDVVAGLPAQVRLAHTAVGLGPLTFVTSQGGSVTLSLGESVDVPIRSGTVDVQLDGSLSDINIDGFYLVRGGDRLELFGTSWGLTGWFINQTSVPADSGLVRFAQATGGLSWAPVVYLGAPGASEAASRLIDCYFDPLYMTEYVLVPAGPVDVILGNKQLVETGRVRITVTPGRAVTYVIAGETPQTIRLMAFPDF